MSSISDAIPIKTLPKSEVFERIFSQGFLLMIIFLVACRQEILEEIFGKNLRT